MNLAQHVVTDDIEDITGKPILDRTIYYNKKATEWNKSFVPFPPSKTKRKWHIWLGIFMNVKR